MIKFLQDISKIIKRNFLDVAYFGNENSIIVINVNAIINEINTKVASIQMSFFLAYSEKSFYFYIISKLCCKRTFLTLAKHFLF